MRARNSRRRNFKNFAKKISRRFLSHSVTSDGHQNFLPIDRLTSR
jgi:hypothetical protein